MPRRPLGERPMTAAERQAARRQRQREAAPHAPDLVKAVRAYRRAAEAMVRAAQRMGRWTGTGGTQMRRAMENEERCVASYNAAAEALDAALAAMPSGGVSG